MKALVLCCSMAGAIALGFACLSSTQDQAVAPGKAAGTSVTSRQRRESGGMGDDAARATARVRGLGREGRFEEAWSAMASLPANQRAEWAVILSSLEAATDPCSAWERTGSIEGELRDACREAVIQRGSDAFLPQLAELAAAMADSPLRENLLTGIVSRWAIQDPAALSQWPELGSIPARVRDEAALRLVVNGDSMNRSSDTALAWANSISDPQIRQTAVETAMRETSAPGGPSFVDPDAGEPPP